MEFLSSNINQIIFIICGLIGGLAHYFKKYLKKETDVNLYEWFGPSNTIATVYTLIVFIFIMIGALASGMISIGMSIWAVMYTGFITGFAVDAGVNSDSKSITSDLTGVKSDTSTLFLKEDKKE